MNFKDEKNSDKPLSDDDKTQAKEFQNEIKETKEAYEKAKREGTSDADNLEIELNNLEEAYTALFDLKGNARTNSKEGKARIAVYKRIKKAKEHIRKYIPNLFHHLNTHINTGNDITYRPQNPINWQTAP